MAEPLTINVTRAATPAPAVYRVPGSAEIEALSAFARFDGTGAATSFRPALTFYSAAGLILARVFPGDSVAAGGTADVTFAPFLSSDSAAAPSGGGLEFGGAGQVYGAANTGDYLSVVTDDIGSSGFSIDLVSTSAPGIIGFEAGVELKATNGGKIYLLARGTPTHHPEQQLFISIENGIEIDADTDFALYAGNSILLAVELNNVLTVPAATVNSDGADVNIILDSFASGAATGHKLTVWDQDPDGPGANPIFEVRDDGSIHGRAAVGAITWDL